MENQPESDKTLTLTFLAAESLNNNKVNLHCSTATTLFFSNVFHPKWPYSWTAIVKYRQECTKVYISK